MQQVNHIIKQEDADHDIFCSIHHLNPAGTTCAVPPLGSIGFIPAPHSFYHDKGCGSKYRNLYTLVCHNPNCSNRAHDYKPADPDLYYGTYYLQPHQLLFFKMPGRVYQSVLIYDFSFQKFLFVSIYSHFLILFFKSFTIFIM